MQIDIEHLIAWLETKRDEHAWAEGEDYYDGQHDAFEEVIEYLKNAQ